MSGNHSAKKDVHARLGSGEFVNGADGRYWRVDAAVGAGTCCTVWTVHLGSQPSRKAVLKLYKLGDLYEAAASREKLLVNLVRTMRGKCPYIVEVLDSFSHDGHACLVQTHLEGDIHQLRTKNIGQVLSPAVTRLLLLHLLRGLSILHSLGFVHADLKPDNLLWNPQEGVLTIIDFGLSFHVKDTAVGEVQSPGYRAPEVQIWNDRLMRKCGKDRGSHRHDKSTELNKSASYYHQTSEPSYSTHLTSCSKKAQRSPCCNRHQQQGEKRTYGEMIKTSSNCDSCDSVTVLQDSVGHKHACADVRGEAEHIAGYSSGAVSKPNLSADLDHIAEYFKGGVSKPGPAADLWSVGCIILDLITGSKFFTSKRRATFATKLMMNLDTIIHEAVRGRCEQCQREADRTALWQLGKLCTSLLQTDPSKRLSVDNALKHPFFITPLELSHRDLLLLPCPVLRVLNAMEAEKSYPPEEVQDILEEIQEECDKYGKVTEVATCQDTVYVVFAQWTAAVEACGHLFKRRFDGRLLSVCYFPLEEYITHRKTAVVISGGAT